MRANVVTKVAPRVDRSESCTIPCFKAERVRAIRSKMPGDRAVEDAQMLFAALADRTRLKILFALRGAEELCVCDVAHVVGLSISTASHHLRRLRDLRILKHRNDGKMAYYSLRDKFATSLVVSALSHTEQSA